MAYARENDIVKPVTILHNEQARIFRLFYASGSGWGEYFFQYCKNGVCINLKNCGPDEEDALVYFEAELLHIKYCELYQTDALYAPKKIERGGQ